MNVETVQLYENRPDVTLTAYVIEESAELQNEKPRPAIMICPGGAYAFCSDREAEPIALRFAAMGYQAFVLRYSVFHKGRMVNPLKELEPDPDSLYPNAMCDIGAAMLCIRKKASEWRVDPDAVVLCGFSAGAHNCAMFCTHWNSKVLQERFHRPEKEFRPAGAILGYGFYDWVDFRKQKVDNKFLRAMNEAIDFSYFGVRHPSEEQLAKCSPARCVTDKTPPMFLWTTGSDRTVPPEQSLMMGVALAKAHIPYELHSFETGDHGLANADESTACSREQVNAEVAQWMQMAQRWLRRNVPIDLPEKPPMGFDLSLLHFD